MNQIGIIHGSDEIPGDMLPAICEKTLHRSHLVAAV